MINFKIDESNDVIVTLQERVTISNPFFLLVVTPKGMGDTIKEWVVDVSAHPSRYNKFVVSLSGLFVGQYEYNFYQKANQDNQSTEGARLLETGIFRVYDDKEENTYYEPA